MSEPTAIFSGGTGRSGTTIVAKLLRCHPQIRASRPLEVRCITDSAGLLDLCIGVRPNASAGLRLLAAYPPALRWEFERRMRGRWWRRTNRLGNASGLHRGIDDGQRSELIRELCDELRNDPLEAGRKFVVNLARAQGLVDERYWIDTSPPNAANADLLHTLMPDARFVHMVRDGRDTMASVLQESWGPDDPQAAARWWAERVTSAHRALSNVPTHLVHTVQLEALVVSDRQMQYQGLLEFLGLPDRRRMRAYFAERMPAERGRPGVWRERVSDPRAVDSAYRAAAEQLSEAGIPTYEYP